MTPRPAKNLPFALRHIKVWTVTMHTPVLSDEPASVCALGRKALCADLKSRLTLCTPPQTFGVFGDWGSGKTSFLRTLQTELEGDRNSLSFVIWFEAWRYQHEPTPIIALLHEIRQQITWKKDFLKSLGRQAAKATEIGIMGALLSLEDLTGKIGFKASKIQQQAERWEREHNATPLPTHVIREQLDAALTTLLSANKKSRLVIVIDDLDRCHPAAALRLLDGIKIYLNVSKCVFVLGLNPREIQRGIEKEVPTADDDDHRSARAAEYLEKICGYAVRLPYLHPKAQGDIVRNWLSCISKGLHFPIDTAGEFAQIVEVSSCLPPNPRKMKAWCNSLLHLIARRFPIISLTSAELPSSGHTDDDKVLAWAEVKNEREYATLAACLYTFHPELHRRLNRNPMLIRKLETWAKNPTRAAAHLALTGKVIPGTDSDSNIPLNDLSRLVPTHQTCGPDFVESDWDAQRCIFDPSLPAIFYCQRLLVATCARDNATEFLSKWLTL